jgi:hypothetical protein
MRFVVIAVFAVALVGAVMVAPPVVKADSFGAAHDAADDSKDKCCHGDEKHCKGHEDRDRLKFIGSKKDHDDRDHDKDKCKSDN